MLVRISAVDTATAVVNSVQRLASSNPIMTLKTDITSLVNAQKTVEGVVKSVPKSVNTSVVVDTSAAERAIKDVTNSVNTATGNLSSRTTSDMGKMSSALDQATSRSDKLKGAWSAITQVGSGMSNTINGVTDSINTATLAIGAITAIGTNQVFRASSLAESLGENYRGEELFRVQEYIKNKPEYVSEDALIRGLVKTKQRGMSLDESIQMADVLGKVQFTHAGTWQQQGLTVDTAMNRVNSIAAQARSAVRAGNELSGEQIEQLANLGFGEVKKKDINEAYSQLMREGAVRGKTRGEDLDKIFRRALLNTQNNLEIDENAPLSVSQQILVMKTKLEDIRSVIALKVVPVLLNFVKVLSKIVDVINAIPGATKFIAYATVLTTVAVIASRLAGTFGVLATAIKGAAAAFDVYNKVSMAGNATDLVGQRSFIGPKKGLNVPLMRSRMALEGVELVGDSGIVAKMRKSFVSAAGDSRSMGAIISGAFHATATGVKGSFNTMLLAAKEFFLYLLTNPLVAIVAIIAAIVLLAYKFGYLQRAWDKFANSNFGKDVLWFFSYLQTLIWATIGCIDQMWNRFKKGSGADVLKVFDAVAAIIGDIFDKFDAFYVAIKKGDIKLTIGAAGALFESLGKIDPIFMILSMIFKFWKEVYETFKNPIMIIVDFITRLYDAIVGLWKWFKTVFPGAEKGEAKDQLVKEAGKYGLTYDDRTGQFLDKNKTIVDITQDPVYTGLREKLEAYENAPGFFTDLIDYLEKAMPGREKRALQTALETQMAGAGINEYKISGVPGAAGTFKINAATPSQIAERNRVYGTNAAEYMTIDQLVNRMKSYGVDEAGVPFTREEEARREAELRAMGPTAIAYEAAPGFAEEIADAVIKGLSTLGDIIETAFTSALDSMPGYETLETAITFLSETIEGLKGAVDGLTEWIFGENTAKKTLADYGITYKTTLDPLGINEAEFEAWQNGVPLRGDQLDVIKRISKNEDTEADIEEMLRGVGIEPPSAGIGGLIKKSGIAYVHSGEPIVPADIASSSLLIDRLGALASNTGTTSTDQSVNYQNTFHFHLHGNGVVFDQRTKTELTRFMDDYMSKSIRHRQAH